MGCVGDLLRRLKRERRKAMKPEQFASCGSSFDHPIGKENDSLIRGEFAAGDRVLLIWVQAERKSRRRGNLRTANVRSDVAGIGERVVSIALQPYTAGGGESTMSIFAQRCIQIAKNSGRLWEMVVEPLSSNAGEAQAGLSPGWKSHSGPREMCWPIAVASTGCGSSQDALADNRAKPTADSISHRPRK